MALLSLSEAIARHVHDGQSVALEGFTHLIPFAAGHEIIRQQRRGLHLIRMTPDLIHDQMIGAGCAAHLTFSWGGNPGVGSLHRLRDALEKQWPQPLSVTERTHAEMAVAYQAGASGLPCGLMRQYAPRSAARHCAPFPRSPRTSRSCMRKQWTLRATYSFAASSGPRVKQHSQRVACS
jgi:glutaconate CoA-transferase subunit A